MRRRGKGSFFCAVAKTTVSATVLPLVTELLGLPHLVMLQMLPEHELVELLDQPLSDPTAISPSRLSICTP